MVNRFQAWFGNGLEGILSFLITIFCVFLSLSFHEFSHGYVAYKLGDNTAKNMGRLSLNPLSHLDPIGALCLLLFGFGWARPVPINPNNFESGKYKKGMVLTSIAGPVSNILLAFISILIIKILGLLPYNLPTAVNILITVVSTLCQTLIIMNLSLAVFNLIPIPPLDGSKVLNAVLPARIYFKIMQYEQFGFIALIILINLPIFNSLLTHLVLYIYKFLIFIIELIPFF